MMRLPGQKTVIRSARWLRSRPRQRALLLGYHRIEDVSGDPYGLSVSSARFAEQMEVLARLARPLRLRDFVTAHSRSIPFSGSVVVTFDDGYADALAVALPILEQYGIPATVFVVSGYLGREFWWDELARLSTAERLAGKATGGTTALLGEHAAGLRAMPDSERRRSLETLAVDAIVSRPALRALTQEELYRLARSELMEIGAHTVTHPMLTLLSEGEQRCEMQDSRKMLEAITGRPVFSFAYPHGAYSEKTVRLVRQAGYTAACCSTPDVASDRSDLLTLPRFWIGDWDGDRFERFLRRWLLD